MSGRYTARELSRDAAASVGGLEQHSNSYVKQAFAIPDDFPASRVELLDPVDRGYNGESPVDRYLETAPHSCGEPHVTHTYAIAKINA